MIFLKFKLEEHVFHSSTLQGWKSRMGKACLALILRKIERFAQFNFSDLETSNGRSPFELKCQEII